MAEDAVAVAFEAFNQGKLEETSELCRRLLDTAPAPALMLLGLIAKRQGRFDEAAAQLERSVQLAPNPKALASLADCLWRTGRLAEGLRRIEEFMAGNPDNAEARLLAAALLHGMGRYDAALEQTRRAQALQPESHLVEARLGCILTELGQFESAERHFRAAARIEPAFSHCGLINFRRGVWREIEPRPDAAAVEELAALRPPSARQPFTAVIAAFSDARYFRKYGVTFVNSFAQNAAQDRLLHLHILDPDSEFATFLERLLQRVKLPNIAATYEYAPMDDSADFNLRRTFYSCARFLRLNSLLAGYRTPIACLDIDTVFEAPLDPLIATAGDVGLVQREPRDSPWLDIVANAVLARNTQQAGRYLAAVSSYVRHFMRRGKLYWHLDQIALYCVLKMMERFAEPPQVGWISSAARAAIWHIGNPYDHRLRDERVARYQLAGFAALS